MTIVQYNEIVKRVNNDSLEKLVYEEIERYCEERGYEVYQIEYNKYLQMRNYLIKINKDGLKNKLESVNNDAGNKKVIKDHSNRNQIIKTLLIIGILVAVAQISDPVKFFAYSGAIITAIIGFGTLPALDGLRSGYDSDYVQRYFRAHENARINTRAYLNQAYLHSGELKILNNMINNK